MLGTAAAASDDIQCSIRFWKSTTALTMRCFRRLVKPGAPDEIRWLIRF
jgi:hypothetical protein